AITSFFIIYYRNMAGRTRGVPNLALAGMREEKGTSNGQQNNRGRGRGRGRGGRGGRGRGGGGGAGKPRQELIQTMGVFSEGLHAEDRKKERVKLEFEGGSQKRVKEETTTIAEMTNAQVSSARGYAELWESDESGDEEELKDLLRDNFLNDAKSGRVLPLVTPIEEEAQFKKCMASSSSVKKEIMSDEEDEKPRISPPLDEEDPFPTLTRSREAADVMEKMMSGGSSELLLLQIPSIVPILARATVEGREEAPLDPATPATVPCPSGLPRGKRVGSMKATPDGGVELCIGGQKMTLTKNIGGTTGYCDTLAMVEVPPSALESKEATGMFGVQANAHSGASVSHLGNIQHYMVAALDWSASLANSRRTKKEDGSGKKRDGEEDEMDMSSVKKEVASPQKSTDRASLESRMEAVAKRRLEREKFLIKWGTE
ncbi:hypothetical protein PMAYCL1PPCAC_28639, partial [Pristionchus mayeri]